MGAKKNPKNKEKLKYLSGSFAVCVVKETRRVGLFIVKLIPSFWGFEIGL